MGQVANIRRVDEPISCAMRTHEITGAPLGGPIRPAPGNSICKGTVNHGILRCRIY